MLNFTSDEGCGLTCAGRLFLVSHQQGMDGKGEDSAAGADAAAEPGPEAGSAGVHKDAGSAAKGDGLPCANGQVAAEGCDSKGAAGAAPDAAVVGPADSAVDGIGDFLEPGSVADEIKAHGAELSGVDAGGEGDGEGAPGRCAVGGVRHSMMAGGGGGAFLATLESVVESPMSDGTEDTAALAAGGEGKEYSLQSAAGMRAGDAAAKGAEGKTLSQASSPKGPEGGEEEEGKHNKYCHFCQHVKLRASAMMACENKGCARRYCEHCLTTQLKDDLNKDSSPAWVNGLWTCPVCRKMCCCASQVCKKSPKSTIKSPNLPAKRDL